MGSGSDYTPFVQHLGIASVNIAYGGEGQSGGVYHSAYDTFEHYERFGDPGFAYGVVMAETGGRLVLRAADADLLPLQFSDAADTVAAQVGELKRLVVTQREHAQTVDRLLDQKAFVLAADPTLTYGAPDREDAAPDIDFAPLDAAVARLKASAHAYDLAAAAAPASANAQRVDVILQGVEQALTDARGLPGRPWYRHLIYAPGMLTGYGAKTLPGVREAIEERRWAEAGDYIARTAAVLTAMSAKLDEATRLLAG
jgi:N-acetylated-alpha-linked acidic dipeptidase